MKIMTIVTLATCAGLALGWMSSFSAEHSESTRTREVETTSPSPEIASAAHVVIAPGAGNSPNDYRCVSVVGV